MLKPAKVRRFCILAGRIVPYRLWPLCQSPPKLSLARGSRTKQAFRLQLKLFPCECELQNLKLLDSQADRLGRLDGMVGIDRFDRSRRLKR